MSYEPGKYDLMRLAGLRPKVKSEEEKRYPSFNTRMMAATVDMFLLTITLLPIVNYAFMHFHGLPPVTMDEVMQHMAERHTAGEASYSFVQAMKQTGYFDYWVMLTSWQLYMVMIYACVCWHIWSATPGKMLFRMVIIDDATERPMGDWQSILRVFGYIVSAIPLGLGFFWIGFDKKRRGWHDYIASTRVVKKSSLKKTTSTTEAAHPSDSPAPSEAE